ncbi:MAG: class I SAM-dependent methyltransferase [Faecousia sp.]
MKIPMTNRLLACCGFVRPGDRVIDVGTDHGYLGIYLLQNGIASSVIASDIAEGPLAAARQNAVKFGLSHKMRFFLSDGLQSVPRDFDCMVCAGMGADTMVSILERSPWLRDPRYRLVLQCQSRRPILREYLSSTGYRIRRETLAKDGKFLYTVMEAVYEPGEPLTPAQCWLSPALLESGSPLLPAFYGRVAAGLRATVEGLSRSGSEKLEQYRRILTELSEMEESIYGNRS